MIGHDRLGPGVREVVEAVQNPRSVRLQDLSPGDKLTIKAGERPEDLLDFTIVTPAQENCDKIKKSAIALLPGWKWDRDIKEEAVEILIGGSCTYNPGSPLGMSMLSMGTLSVGRNFVMWLGDTDECIIYMTPIESIVVEKVSPEEANRIIFKSP